MKQTIVTVWYDMERKRVEARSMGKLLDQNVEEGICIDGAAVLVWAPAEGRLDINAKDCNRQITCVKDFSARSIE